MRRRYPENLSRRRVPLNTVGIPKTTFYDKNIRVAEALRYYPYRLTFNFECYFDSMQLPSDCDKVWWIARHAPLNIAVVSNVPGHEEVRYLVTDGDSYRLVADMMKIRTKAINEPVDSFVTDVKLLVRDCGVPLDNVDDMIHDRLVYGTNSRKVRERFINRGADLNLQNATEPLETVTGH